jgi:hypothetical protein
MRKTFLPLIGLVLLLGAGCSQTDSSLSVQTPDVSSIPSSTDTGTPTPQPPTIPQANATDTIQALSLPNGQSVYAVCQRAGTGETVYAVGTRGVDAGGFQYFDASGTEIATSTYMIPRGSQGTDIPTTNCTTTTREDFLTHVTGTNDLP